MSKNNVIANFLFIIGIIEIVAGIVLGIIFGTIEVEGYYSSYTSFSWSIFLLWSVGGIISGIIFIGFSEIINLLNRIYYQINKSNEGN